MVSDGVVERAVLSTDGFRWGGRESCAECRWVQMGCQRAVLSTDGLRWDGRELY